MESKIINYLNNNNRLYHKNSVKYNGVRENMEQVDGSIKTMHVVPYMVSLSNQKYYSYAFYFAYFDEKNLNLEYIWDHNLLKE
ncbi:hypothetical protein EZY14_013415 [Kordia sp. TARA_039_SRF]|nr:hypothetical protein EZY14_013415 [Kordia sp. TARA_039_SRF]